MMNRYMRIMQDKNLNLRVQPTQCLSIRFV